MRERRQADWVQDLRERHDLEHRVARVLGAHPQIRLDRVSTASFTDLDFLTTVAGTSVPIELKSKWQSYVGWELHAPHIEQQNMLILDELALRRMIENGHHAHLLIMDRPGKRWVVFGIPELVLVEKVRVVRAIRRHQTRSKAKLLIDLRHGTRASTLGGALEVIVERLKTFDRRWNAIEPWPLPGTEVS